MHIKATVTIGSQPVMSKNWEIGALKLLRSYQHSYDKPQGVED
jgi:hypothetical protein